MIDLPIIKKYILNIELNKKINQQVLKNIFWFDFYCFILKEKNKFFYSLDTIDLNSEIIKTLFYLQLKMINQSLFINLDFKKIFINIKDQTIKIYIDPSISIINLNKNQKKILHDIYILDKNENINFENELIIKKSTKKLLELKNNFKCKKFIIRSFLFDNYID